MHALAHAPLIQHGKQVGTMEPIDEIDGAVRPYLETGTCWQTVTPLVTHGKTTRGGRQKGKFDRRKAEKLILHALAKVGLPEPARMHYQSAPFRRSGRAAREYRVPHHLSGLSRFHVSVEFPQPVSGPVLAGVGSHFGLGLFARSS
jgi:CRISPR-associated protein Csb2